jgi:hypothetical protein
MKFKMTQRELNTLFENPKIEFAFKFSYILKTILMTFFFIPILPCGVLISLCGLILAYWIEKYYIVRHYKLPEMPNENLADFLLDNFKVILFVYSVNAINIDWCVYLHGGCL